jgi:ubiquitin-protein ligase
MSIPTPQLDEIYRQLKDFFDSHPAVLVKPTKGDPPDQYEISYTINGMCKTDDGKIVESVDHTVELAIPFGFPHFPPSCKPKSDIFHPDFDPAAICLSDFWEEDRPLSDLIIHIGQMINGEIYSKTNAFNEDAAEWYQDNSSKFPLAQIKWKMEKASKSSPGHRLHKIDTLDENDLTTDFDFLALEEELANEDSFPHASLPEVNSPAATDFELINLLESQKKYYTLLEEAENNKNPSDQLSKLFQHARDEVRKVEKLHRDGKKLEKEGDAQIAFKKYQQITTFVSDFPTIDSDIQRIKQTLALIADINPDIALNFSEPRASAETTDPADNLAIKKDASKNSQEAPATQSQTQTPHEQFLPEKRDDTNPALFLCLGLLAIGIGYSVFFWYSSTATLSNAEAVYSQCSIAHTNSQYVVAKGLCDKTLQLISEVKFTHRDRAEQLKKSVSDILHSERLSQGLAGNILLNGRYIPKNEVKIVQSIQQKLSEAEELFTKKKWQAALELYGTLLTQAENNAYFTSQVIEDIRRKLLISEFRSFYDPAQVSIQNSQWEDAIKKLLQAQKILVSLSESDRSQYSEQLQNTLQISQFANLKAQGDLSFTGSDWKSAMAAYNLALASGQESSLPPESIAAIRNNIKRAELYTTINKGNKAFASGAWDEAIEAYRRASGLLISNKGVASAKDSNINIQKLARIILQASIIRDRQTVQTLLEKNDLENARRTYLQIVTRIQTSSFGSEEEFSKTAAEITAAIKSLDEKGYLIGKVEYLKNNYQSIFTTNYPEASAEKLTNPVIKNTRKTKSKLVFRMQCTETGRGRPLTLVMHYAYDKNTDKWSIFSEN